MQIHADLTKRAVVDSNALPWVASPLAGVERRMLERDGAEVARATSLVRYAANAYFAAHTHGGGEEFLVLDGVFSDESGDFPTGMYVRNPVGSSHTPFSRQGATILVKLRQFDPTDQTFVRVDTHCQPWQPSTIHGIDLMPLHTFNEERVFLIRWQAGVTADHHVHTGGEEVFVLSGEYHDEQGSYPIGTWIRNPPGSTHQPISHTGCLLFVKTGHLRSS